MAKKALAAPQIDSKASWVTGICQKTGVDRASVERFLSRHQIEADSAAASPSRLIVTRVGFEGVKDGTANEPFQFDWENLQPGLHGLVTDENLRGKTSVLHLIRWLSRGRSTIQPDV